MGLQKRRAHHHGDFLTLSEGGAARRGFQKESMHAHGHVEGVVVESRFLRAKLKIFDDHEIVIPTRIPEKVTKHPCLGRL